MTSVSARAAVLLLIFNRLDTTKQVLEAIRAAQPDRLYIACDGPRSTHPAEAEAVQAVRDYVIHNIDWGCEVKTLFRNKNLGCKAAVESAVSWFFEHEDMGIILEDDCLPSQSFFRFCEALLQRYKDDTRIMMISGFNKQGIWQPNGKDYFFSHLGGIWGWASWRRAWSCYDPNMSYLSLVLKRHYLQNLLGKKIGKLREQEILKVKSENIDTWDFYWGFSRHINSGLSCVSSKNLVKNIGFGNKSTHTSRSKTFANELHELDFPLTDNNLLIVDREYDNLFIDNLFQKAWKRAVSVFR